MWHAGGSQALSERSATSIASELYHEQPAGDLTALQAMQTIEFHLLVFCCFVTMGAALSLLMNQDQMLAALAPLDEHGHSRRDSELEAALVVCFSVCNTLGRVAAGYLSELALHRRVRISCALQDCAVCCMLCAAVTSFESQALGSRHLLLEPHPLHMCMRKPHCLHWRGCCVPNRASRHSSILLQTTKQLCL